MRADPAYAPTRRRTAAGRTAMRGAAWAFDAASGAAHAHPPDPGKGFPGGTTRR